MTVKMTARMKRKNTQKHVEQVDETELSLDELLDSLAKDTEEEARSPYKFRRDVVYKAIDGERDYQDKKWGNTLSGGRPGNGERTVDEFVTYIVGYANDLLVNASHFAKTEDKLHIVRKVAGLCVACMEQHGAPERDKHPLPFNMKKL